MPLLYNNKSQTIENIPDEGYTQAVASGAYSPRQKAIVPVVYPDGSVGNIAAENAQMAFNDGLRYYGTAEANAKSKADIAQIKQEAYDAPMAAAALGAARGLTFGASDVVARGVGSLFGEGKDTADALLNLREQNPIASTVGEIGGAVGGAFLPIGPVAAVSSLGAKVTAKAGAGLAELAAKGSAGQIAAEIMSKGAGSAIEGAFYATGEILTEAALGDPKLTAANIGLNYGVNVLGGGLLGGMIPGAATATAKTMRKVGDWLRDDLNVPSKAIETVGKIFSKLRITDAEDQLAFKEFSKATPEARQMRDFTLDMWENPDKAVDFTVRAVKDLKDLGITEASHLGDVRKTAGKAFESVPIKNGETIVTPIVTKLDEALTKLSDRPNRYTGGAATDITDALESLKVGAASATNMSELHQVVHASRQLIDDAFGNVFKSAKRTGDAAAANTRDVVMKARDELSSFLRSETHFPGFGEGFGKADKAYRQFYNAKDQFIKKFEEETIGGAKEVSMSKAQGMINSPLSSMARTKQEIIDKMAAAVEGLGEASGNQELTKAGIEQIKDVITRVKSAKAASILINRIESKTGRSLMAPAVGFAIGSGAQEIGLTDMPGAGVTGALGGALLANPKTIMTYLMRMERGNMAAANAAQEASKKLLGLPVPASAAGALKALSGVRKQGLVESLNRIELEEHEQDKDNIDLFKSRVQPLEQIKNLDYIVKQNMPLMDDIAPETYAQLVNIHSRGIVYLKSKLPPDRDALFAGKTIMSEMQKISLNRSIAAVQNPAELFHEMAEKNIRPETVDAVRVVYPELFAQIQMELSEALADKKVQAKIDRRTRIELSKVLGIPTTESTQNLDLLQGAWNKPQQQSQAKPSNFKLPSMASGMDAINARLAEG